MVPVSTRVLIAALLTLLSYLAGFFSLYLQLDPFVGGPRALTLISAGSGLGFAVGAAILAGRRPPRGFSLVGVGLNAVAATLAAMLLFYV